MDEPLARVREAHSSVVSDEKSCPDFVLQVAYASADGRFLNAHSRRRAPKASMLGGGYDIAEMAQFNRQSVRAPRS
jgi:hypothetical protein